MNPIFSTILASHFAASAPMPERSLDPPETGIELTTEEENGIQAELERRAAREYDDGDSKLMQWLSISKRARQDYIDFRVSMASDAERDEIFNNL